MTSRSEATIKTDGNYTYFNVRNFDKNIPLQEQCLKQFKRRGRSKWYALTISAHKKNEFVSKNDIDQIIIYLKWLHPKLKVRVLVYENTGRYKQLHAHLLVSNDRYVRFKDNCSIQGYRLQWDQINDAGHCIRAYSYITKEVRNAYMQEQVFITNICTWNGPQFREGVSVNSLDFGIPLHLNMGLAY